MIPSPGPVHKHLVVEGVRMDVDGGDLEGLAVGGYEASRVSFVEAKGALEGGIGGVQNDRRVGVL